MLKYWKEKNNFGFGIDKILYEGGCE